MFSFIILFLFFDNHDFFFFAFSFMGILCEIVLSTDVHAMQNFLQFSFCKSNQVSFSEINALICEGYLSLMNTFTLAIIRQLLACA